jgi:hypothetical protein
MLHPHLRHLQKVVVLAMGTPFRFPLPYQWAPRVQQQLGFGRYLSSQGHGRALEGELGPCLVRNATHVLV